MLNIIKIAELADFTKFIKKEKPTNWSEIDLDLKAKLNNYILENEQNKNGIFYCAYCEKKIDTIKSHIEHIKPRDTFSMDIFNYDNLIVSCETKDSCGKVKDNNYFDDFISPITHNPSDYFTYLENGEIYSTNQNAIDTYELLNLNNKKLKEARQTIILQLKGIDDLDKIIRYYDDFPTLIEYIKVDS
jgi:uncharacterized protein (TIGR02646 family)